MKSKLKPLYILGTVLMTAFLFVILFPAFRSQAGTLGDTYLYLSRIKANLDGSGDNDVEMILAITPSQSFNEADNIEILIAFPMDDDTDWCRTAGALTVTGVASAPPDVTGQHEITAALPTEALETLTANCSQGDGSTTVDTITITKVGDLVSTETYGVELSNNVGALGTSSTTGSKTITAQVSDDNNLDSKAFGVYLISEDTVEIEATVSDAPTIGCALVTDKVDLGTLYPNGALVEVTSTDQITTSSTGSGYYWAAYGEGDGTDGGLYTTSGAGYLIESRTDVGEETIVGISSGGSEGFGITLTQPSGSTVPSDFATGTPGQYGAIGSGTSHARLILYRTSSTASQSASVNYGARAGASAVAGTYTEYITYVCGGYY
jgi:hypothetical protein